MVEWTTVINSKNLNNPYWNIYIYEFIDERGRGFKVGKADSGVIKRYSNSDLNGKIFKSLAHQDIVTGKDSDIEIVRNFKLDERFEFKGREEYEDGSDETFFPKEGFTVDDAIKEFEDFFKKENTVRYSLSKEEEKTVDEIIKHKYTVGYICPRYHKTALILNIINKRNNLFNIMLSYAHTVEQSYLNDVKSYGLDIKILNADNVSKEEIQEYLDAGQKVLVVFFMTGTEDGTHERRLSKLNKWDANVYIDEADIGLSTEISNNKIKALCNNVNVKELFVASGTGIDKMKEVVKSFGKKLKVITRSYIQDVLMPRGDKATEITFIKFKNTYPLLEKIYPDCVFENWNDSTIENNRNSIENLLKMFFKQDDFFNSLQNAVLRESETLQRIGNLRSFVEKHFNKDSASIIFVGNKNKTHNFVKNILDSLDIPAFIIDGNETNGGNAEEYANGILKAYPNAVFIATNMANRSFSVSKIKNEIILMNDPVEASYTQKVYRIATNDSVFKTGYVWDFTLGDTDDNLFGIIKPELDRGEELGLTTEKTLEKILETKRVNFIFEALDNPEAFNEIKLENLSKQLIMTTNYFDVKFDEIAVSDTHEFTSNVKSGKKENNKKGKGDRSEKTIVVNSKNKTEDNEKEELVDNRKILKEIKNLIIGTKTYFESFDRDSVPTSFEDYGFEKDDIIYVYDLLCKNFGEEVIKQKMDDSYQVQASKGSEELNLRTFDYDVIPKWKSYIDSWDNEETVIAIGLKSPYYIEKLKKRFKKVVVLEHNDFNKEAFTFENELDVANILDIMSLKKTRGTSKMKIIMNPPYDGNRHLKILSVVAEQCQDAEIVNLSPIRWLQDPLAEYKKNSDFIKFEDIRTKIESLDILPATEAQSIFNAGIWGDLGTYHITNNAKGYEFSFKYKWFIDKVILKMKDNIGNHMTPERGKCDFSRPFIKVSELHGHQGQKDFYDFTSPDIKLAKSTKGGSCAHTVNFDTEEEADNFFYSLQTNFYKFINICVKQSMNVPWIFAPWLNDYSHPWTDEQLYKYFDLTPEEIKEIEDTIK